LKGGDKMGRKYGRSRDDTYKYIFVVVIAVLSVFTGYYLLTQEMFGLPDLSAEYITYITPLGGIVFIAYVMRKLTGSRPDVYQKFGIFIGFFAIGMLFAMLAGQMNDNGFLVSNFLTTSLTIADVQLSMVFICSLVGLLAAVRTD